MSAELKAEPATAPEPWLSVIGIGEDGIAGLSPAACTLMETAEVLIGGERHLALVPASASGRAERPALSYVQFTVEVCRAEYSVCTVGP